MMTSELDSRYFEWLSHLVYSSNHHNLLKALFHKEFVWFVANDDNRAVDGKDLRGEFLQAERLQDVGDFLDIGCSMFEMLIGLARRLQFETDGTVREWFWHLIKNASLEKFTDEGPLPIDRVDDILDRLIWRTYNPDGIGGLFPRTRPEEDQRSIELWYQMSGYLLEIGAY
jgi:hypothetical protein